MNVPGTLTGSEGVVGRWVSLPALLVAVLWIGIWFLWPSEPAEWGRGMRSGATVISMKPFSRDGIRAWHLAPDIFALPSRVGFSAPPIIIGLPEESGSMGSGTPVVQENVPYQAQSAFNGTSAAEGGMPLGLGTFRMPVPGSQAFGSTGQKKPRLVVWMDGKLEGDGLELPLFHEDAFQGGTEPFEVVAFVQTDEDGKVTHVFVEKPCPQSSVNELIVRQLYRAQALVTGTASAGRVVVSWLN